MASLATKNNPTIDDWQSGTETVRDRTAFLFNNSLMSDVKFAVQDSTGGSSESKNVSIPAHKLILAISSPVFYAMFYGGMAERRPEIHLPDTCSVSLLEFLRFLYGCDEAKLASANVLGVLYLAKKYMVAALIRRCSTFLANSINTQNVCEILMEARKFEDDNLERKCWELIISDTRECLKSSSFQRLDRVTIKCLLEQDTLTIDEYSLFQEVIRWVRAHGTEITGPNVRAALGDIIYLLRFPAMAQEEFAEHVVPLGILSDSEVVSVFMHYCSKDWEQSFRPDSRLDQKIHRCHRFESTHSGPGLNPRNETLTFQANRPIVLHGLRIYSNYYEGCRSKVDVLVQCGDEIIASATGTYTTSRECNTRGFDVHFQKPAYVKGSVAVVLKLTVSAVSVSAGSLCVYPNKAKTSREITASGVKFTFESVAESNILELLFSFS